MYVKLEIGYASTPLAFVIETRKSSGVIAVEAAAAAVTASIDGSTKLPLAFLINADGSLFWTAYANSTYPIVFGCCLIWPVTPSFPLPPCPTGHCGDLSAPTFCFQSVLILDR